MENDRGLSVDLAFPYVRMLCTHCHVGHSPHAMPCFTLGVPPSLAKNLVCFLSYIGSRFLRNRIS